MCDCGGLDCDRSCRRRRWRSGRSGRWRSFTMERRWFWNQRHVEYVALLELGFPRFEFGCWLCGFISSFDFFGLNFCWIDGFGRGIWGGFGVGLVADSFDCLDEFCFVGNGWVIVLWSWSNNFDNASAIGTVIYVVFDVLIRSRQFWEGAVGCKGLWTRRIMIFRPIRWENRVICGIFHWVYWIHHYSKSFIVFIVFTCTCSCNRF